MSVYTDEEVMEMLAEAYLEGKDVEDPGAARRRAAESVAERILDRRGHDSP